MGESCEIMAKNWQISRQDQDQMAYESHRKAATAYDEGFFKDLVVPFNGLAMDNNIRRDTTLEKLAKLKPAFDRSDKGTLTAGNSTPMTDGAASVLLCSEEWAKARGLPVLAYLTYGKYAAVETPRTPDIYAPQVFHGMSGEVTVPESSTARDSIRGARPRRANSAR